MNGSSTKEEESVNKMKNLNTQEEISQAFDRLYPLCRSIMGQGYRDSLSILKEYIDLEEVEFHTGEKVLNWTVPQEWVIREAWIKDSKGNAVIDFKNHNLHVMNYSEPVDKVISLEELKEHIYTSGSDPDAIPYVFSYYKKRWGFAMSKNQLEQLADDEYHVYIDSEFVDGSLVVGHTKLPGRTDKEILLTSYLCHPSMANNELSGPLVLAMLYQRISKWKDRKYTYRFVVNPETIGSISYLSKYGEELKNKVHAGLVFTCLGGDETLRYKMSRRENAPFDYLVSYMNHLTEGTFRVEEFTPDSGSDERQYCSAGFNMPVGQMARKVYGQYKEYHTSLDTKELMGIDNIIDSCDKIETFLKKNEEELFYKNLYPYGEVKLGDYDLYPSLNSNGARKDEEESIVNEKWFIRSVMTILNYADGEHSLSYCAKKLDMDISKIKQVAELLVKRGLLEEQL